MLASLPLPHFSNGLVSFLLVSLLVLAVVDLYRQYVARYDDVNFYHYSMALKSNNLLWNLGYRLENLEIRLEVQDQQMKDLKMSSKQIPVQLRNEGLDFKSRRQAELFLINSFQNNNMTVEILCEENEGILRVGNNDFLADERDSCLIHTAGDESVESGPNTMFEMVLYQDDSFTLKSIANGYYVYAIPPVAADQYDIWKLGVGSVIPGANERFRLSKEGYLYSALLGGFFYCKVNNPVTGSSYGSTKKFVVRRVAPETSKAMRDLAALSKQIQEIQAIDASKYVAKTVASVEEESKSSSNANVNTPQSTQATIKICLGVPITSKGTKMDSIADSPVWKNLFDSFMDSINWRTNKYHFGFYFGFDKADPIYDTGDAWSEIREEFWRRSKEYLQDQNYETEDVEKLTKSMLSIKLMDFDHLEGAPTQIVSQLMLKAYSEGYDYFYQVNDDTQIVTANWAPVFIEALANNPILPNLGVTGPLDLNNDKIFTHSFVHRTHVDIFGYLFPPSFKNWWSDDWISSVYGKMHTFRQSTIEIQHNVGAQKAGGFTRYEIDQLAKTRLQKELMKGYRQLDKWFKMHNLPRMQLPVICDYIPLIQYIAPSLRRPENDQYNSKKSNEL